MDPGAQLPVLWGTARPAGAEHAGFLIAFAALIVYSLLLNRTTLGYEVRAVGFNPDAAAYGGISVRRSYFMAMAISGAFAGTAGSMDVLGWNFRDRHVVRAGILLRRLPRDRGRAARSEHS